MIWVDWDDDKEWCGVMEDWRPTIYGQRSNGGAARQLVWTRPVMMASLTTILGMIPLLTDALFGSQQLP